MNEDIEMDAPQISTLREEETPEPTPARTSKFRVKLLVNEGKRSGSLASSSSHRHAPAESDDEDEDDEDEEDQLIDDDDDDNMKWPAAPAAPPPEPPIAVSTRGAPVKRGRGRGGGGRRRGRAGAPTPGGAMPTFEVAPSEPAATTGQGSHSEVWDPVTATSSTIPTAPPPARKRAPAKGATAQRAIRKKAAKVTKVAAPLVRDDVESVSEAYGGTAASSPMAHDERTPEFEIPLPIAAAPPIPLEDVTLDGVPLPIYPLPSKPFPVQPPLKMAGGVAPSMTVDRSGKPVRHWRQVNREVRGIAGGRWFARTWVGEKESEFASAAAAVQQANAERESISVAGVLAVALPKLPPMTGNAPGKHAKSKAAKVDAGLSGAPSRTGSVAPESTPQVPRKRKSMHEMSVPSSDVPVL